MEIFQISKSLGFKEKLTGIIICDLALLQRWLREKHNIDVESKSVRFTGDVKSSYYQPYINGSIANLNKYNTYEEALEEGLYEGLQLIN